jgi:hypothetical protein
MRPGACQNRVMPLRRILVGVIVLALALWALAACGESRVPAPRLSQIQAPQGMTEVTYLGGGIHFVAPRHWATQAGSGQLVVTYASGPAMIAVWRYQRLPGQRLPTDRPALEQARSALIGAATARDPRLKLLSSAIVDQGRVRGVELDAIERLRGHVRRVRSAHVYAYGAEVVIDEYAPRSLFHAVDRAVFSPLLHSLHLARVGSG